MEEKQQLLNENAAIEVAIEILQKQIAANLTKVVAIEKQLPDGKSITNPPASMT